MKERYNSIYSGIQDKPRNLEKGKLMKKFVMKVMQKTMNYTYNLLHKTVYGLVGVLKNTH